MCAAKCEDTVIRLGGKDLVINWLCLGGHVYVDDNIALQSVFIMLRLHTHTHARARTNTQALTHTAADSCVT